MGTHAMASIEDPPQVYKAGLHTNALLESLSEVVIAWLLLRHAEVASENLPEADDADRAYYEGKIASARLFAAHALPKARLRRESAEAEDASLMNLADESF